MADALLPFPYTLSFNSKSKVGSYDTSMWTSPTSLSTFENLRSNELPVTILFRFQVG
jgi:hypothetical protein